MPDLYVQVTQTPFADTVDYVSVSSQTGSSNSGTAPDFTAGVVDYTAPDGSDVQILARYNGGNEMWFGFGYAVRYNDETVTAVKNPAGVDTTTDTSSVTYYGISGAITASTISDSPPNDGPEIDFDPTPAVKTINNDDGTTYQIPIENFHFDYVQSFWVDVGPTDDKVDNSAKIAALKAQISADQSQIDQLNSENQSLNKQRKSDLSIMSNAQDGYREAKLAANLSAIKDVLKGLFGVAGGPSAIADLIDFVASSYGSGTLTSETVSDYIANTYKNKSFGDWAGQIAAAGGLIAEDEVSINKLAAVADAGKNVFDDLYNGDGAKMAEQFKSEFQAAKADLQSVNGQIADNQDQISSLKSDIGSLQKQISALEADNTNSVSVDTGLASQFSFGSSQNNTAFIFQANGNQQIDHFTISGAEHSVVQLVNSDLNSFADVLRNTQNTTSGVTITDPTTGNTLQIAGVTKAELKANKQDFVFS